jgi:hypothetical protein
MLKFLIAKRPALETILCCLALVAFAAYLETLWPLLWVGCIAPLFLLQSEESTNLANRIFGRIAEYPKGQY